MALLTCLCVMTAACLLSPAPASALSSSSRSCASTISVNCSSVRPGLGVVRPGPGHAADRGMAEPGEWSGDCRLVTLPGQLRL